MTRELILDANHAWLDSFAAEHGERHIVSFSLGKDAIASWLVLLRKFGLANLGDKYLDGRRVEEKLDKLK